MGAQLARDVPYSAICWSTLEPVSSHLLAFLQKKKNWPKDFGCCYCLYAVYFAEKWKIHFSVDIDQEKASKFGWRGPQCF